MEKKSVAVTNDKVSNYIPEEIFFSILSKLSLKSLKRFECVQKSWSLLFENHYFMNTFRYKFLSYSEPASLILNVLYCGTQLPMQSNSSSEYSEDWLEDVDCDPFWEYIA
ncbi:hypothetical protein OROGR_006784 [Orobanche gracilis]